MNSGSVLNTSIKFFLVYAILFFSNSVSSQEIDSLKKTLSKLSDTDKITTYLKIGNEFSNRYSRPDSLLFYSQQAFQLAQATNNYDGEQQSLLSIAIAYSKSNQFDTSIIILKELILKNEKGDDKKLLGDLVLNLGINYYMIDDYKLATSFYIKALNIYESIKDYQGQALTSCKLAAIFTGQKQFEQAVVYSSKAKKLIPFITDIHSKISVLSSLSGLSIQISIQNKDYIDSAIVYAQKALTLANNEKYYSKGNALCLTMSNAYFFKEDFKIALSYCKRAMEYRKYLFPSEIIMTYFNFSDCYSGLKKPEQSLKYLDTIKLYLIKEPSPYYELGLAERIYAYNKDAGNFIKALEGLERFGVLKDSLYSIDKNNAVNDLEQKYNKSENEKKISELNTKNEIASLRVKFLAVGILAAVLILLIIVFFYRQAVLKNKFKVLETEQRLNRARMNPHFFFNALSSIQTLSMDKENNSRVSSLISKFSKIMRQSLESTYDELTTIENEILFLTNYLDIQKTRFENKFDYEIIVDEKLEQNELKVLGMLLQPFLENSIEHGFKNIDYKGKLSIVFRRESNVLKIDVSDNGIGFNTDKIQKEYPSRATQIIVDRLFILNKQHKSRAVYEIKANPAGKGVSVIVELPLIYA